MVDARNKYKPGREGGREGIIRKGNGSGSGSGSGGSAGFHEFRPLFRAKRGTEAKGGKEGVREGWRGGRERERDIGGGWGGGAKRHGGGERRLCSGCGRVSARRGAPAAARHDSIPGEPRIYPETITARSPLRIVTAKKFATYTCIYIHIHIYIYIYIYIYTRICISTRSFLFHTRPSCMRTKCCVLEQTRCHRCSTPPIFLLSPLSHTHTHTTARSIVAKHDLSTTSSSSSSSSSSFSFFFPFVFLVVATLFDVIWRHWGDNGTSVGYNTFESLFGTRTRSRINRVAVRRVGSRSLDRIRGVACRERERERAIPPFFYKLFSIPEYLFPFSFLLLSSFSPRRALRLLLLFLLLLPIR